MRVSATVSSSKLKHDVVVQTDGEAKSLAIPAKRSGNGSAVTGGEPLLLALATCYCNDLYREAQRLEIALEGVEVEASAVFTGVGLAATDIQYRARVSCLASADAIADLLRQTDTVAEVHNTVRAGVPCTLVPDAKT